MKLADDLIRIQNSTNDTVFLFNLHVLTYFCSMQWQILEMETYFPRVQLWKCHQHTKMIVINGVWIYGQMFVHGDRQFNISLRFFMLQFELVCRTTGFRDRRFCAKFSATNRNRYWCYLFHFRETKWWKTGRFLCKSHFHSSLWRIELWIWNWDYFPSREHEFKTTSSEMSGNFQIYTRWNGFLDLGSSDNRFWKILPLLVLVQFFDFFKKIVLTSRISKVF